TARAISSTRSRTRARRRSRCPRASPSSSSSRTTRPSPSTIRPATSTTSPRASRCSSCTEALLAGAALVLAAARRRAQALGAARDLAVDGRVAIALERGARGDALALVEARLLRRLAAVALRLPRAHLTAGLALGRRAGGGEEHGEEGREAHGEILVAP